MIDHLRFADADAKIQQEALQDIILRQPMLMRILHGLQVLDWPDHLLVAGAIYNTVWNHLTERPPLAGINDIDVCYFDASDLSWDAEDRIIKATDAHFVGLPIPTQVRNQARVHLWFESKFGVPFLPLSSSAEALSRYASKTHAIGERLLANGRLHIVAPFGLGDLFAFRMVPNVVLDNRATHTAKSLRCKSIWPEIEVVPWPD